MRRLFITLVLIVILPVLLFSSILFNGSIYSDLRFKTQRNMPMLYNETCINLHMQFKNFNMKIIADGDIFTLNDDMPASLEELSSQRSFYLPLIRINEAYAYIFNFPFPFTDLRAGIQRINMGSGAMMSTLDMLNAYDQTDRWSYDKRLGSLCIELTGYYGQLSWNIGLIPLFSPNILPEEFSMPSFPMPAYVNISSISSTINTENTLKENFQCFLSAQLRNSIGDIGIHYIYWKDTTPWADSVLINPGILPWDVNLHTVLHFPRIHVAGLSFASSLGSVGIWGNAALFIPSDNALTIDLSSMGMNMYDSTNVDGSFYIKGDLGLDYTFTNSFYVNMHYLRGMYYESGNIHDYLFIGSRLPLLHDKLTVSPVNCAVEIASYGDIWNNAAFLYMPSVEYSINNFTCGIKMLYVWSGETCTFYQNLSHSGAGVYVKASF